MKTLYIESQNLNKLLNAFEELNNDSEINSILVLMADSNQYKMNDLESLLRASTKTIIGGLFPEIIFNGKVKSEGVILIPSKKHLRTLLFNLKDSVETNIDSLENKFKNEDNISGTLMIFMHAFSSKNNFFESIFNYFGNNVNYLGSGSGSTVNVDIASVYSNEGIHDNAGIIGLTDEKIEIGVGHGWQIISEALKITKSIGTRIINLNWEPAFNVYKRIIEQYSNKKITSENYNEIAKSYPLGVAKIDDKILVRDPYFLENTDLITLDEIAEGEHVNILHGNNELLLEGARNAIKSISQENESSFFCIDCITRVSYLGKDFIKELEIINIGKVDGVVSLGEIGNTGESFLECYNKTIVVAKW